MKHLTVLFIIILLSACSAKLLTPTQADADRGAQKHPGVTLAGLAEGKKLYEDHCGNCHGLKNPKKESEEEWRKMVPIMVSKINKKAGSTVLDATEEKRILEYVLVMREAAAN